MSDIIFRKVEIPKPNIPKIGAFKNDMTPLEAFGNFVEDKTKRGITIPEHIKVFYDEKGKLREEAIKEFETPFGWILGQSIADTNKKPGPVSIFECPVSKDQLDNNSLTGKKIDEISNAIVFEEENNRIITDVTGISFNPEKDMLSFIQPKITIATHPITGFTEWIIQNGKFDPITAAKITKNGTCKIDLETGLPNKDANSNLELYVWIRYNGEMAGFPHGGGCVGGGNLSFGGRLGYSFRLFYTDATAGSE
ncbi:MAG: hypothetical protein WC356_00215 [Candidatus Micrarchaeia archaeon]|jgi:hypothetical protein